MARKLKTGFTTGTTAAAAAKAAMQCLLGKKPPSRVRIMLLTGEPITIPVHSSVSEDDRTACCTVIKNAGDDPDITHKAEIGARVTLLNDGKETGDVRITGGEGVGLVTKPGLEVPVGEPAINPGPRKMITASIRDVMEKHRITANVGVEVFVPDGERLARKTLNARLGILGGISILGTTGVVKPLSHTAYIATIESAISVAEATGVDTVVFTTGRRSERFSQALWTDFPEEAFIQIGDFFKASLEIAAKRRFHTMILAVFFGKALKMAQGIPHTHAASSTLTLHRLAEWTHRLTRDRSFEQVIRSANTARHAFDLLRNTYPGVISEVGRHIVDAAVRFAGPDIRIRNVIFDYDGTVAYDSDRT